MHLLVTIVQKWKSVRKQKFSLRASARWTRIFCTDTSLPQTFLKGGNLSVRKNNLCKLSHPLSRSLYLEISYFGLNRPRFFGLFCCLSDQINLGNLIGYCKSVEGLLFFFPFCDFHCYRCNHPVTSCLWNFSHVSFHLIRAHISNTLTVCSFEKSLAQLICTPKLGSSVFGSNLRFYMLCN